MNQQKRNRSVNWYEEEKVLFSNILNEYANVIEDRSLNTNSSFKAQAWEEVHKRFNELNIRKRELSQLKMQWKCMKLNNRKACNTFTKETIQSGNWHRPETPHQAVIQNKDMLNPPQLLTDHNSYDSNGHLPDVPSSSNGMNAMTLQDSIAIPDVTLPELELKDNIFAESNIPMIDQIYTKLETPNQNSNIPINDKVVNANPGGYGQTPMRVPRLNLYSKEHPDGVQMSKMDYINNMIAQSKSFREKEWKRRMEMLEEEHSVKMAIHKEKLQCAIMEREILEIKKAQEAKYQL